MYEYTELRKQYASYKNEKDKIIVIKINIYYKSVLISVFL